MVRFWLTLYKRNLYNADLSSANLTISDILTGSFGQVIEPLFLLPALSSKA